MSKVEITKCDGCGRTTEDMWAERGWMEVAGQVALSGGRDEQGNPMKSSVPLGHYCASYCFQAVLQKGPALAAP